MSTQLEIETKYDVDADAPLPDLGAVAGVATSAALAEMVLTATYFDTADLSLASAGITLRRRTGGVDDGWHLKLPIAAGERLEVGRPLGRSSRTPPAALRDLVKAYTRAQALTAVATLTTRRTVHHLLDADGRVLAELADDTVTGTRTGSDEPVTWRELEVELVEGERSLLAELDSTVQAAGIVPATGASKAARVLGVSPSGGGRAGAADAGGGPRGTDSAGPVRLRRRTTAGEVLAVVVAVQVARLRSSDPTVRVDSAGAPERMQDAALQLRTTLSVHRQLLVGPVVKGLRTELRWLADTLADLVDADLVRDGLRARLAAEDRDLVLGPVGRRLDREVAARRRTARAAVEDTLGSSRYAALLVDVERLVQDLPLGPAAAARASNVLPGLVAKPVRRAEPAVAALVRPDGVDGAAASDWPGEQGGAGGAGGAGGVGGAALVAAAVGATGRAWWSAEPLVDVLGSGSADLVDVLRRLHRTLGTLQDTVVLRRALRELAVQSHLSGENAFTFGRLHALYQADAVALEPRLRTLHKALKKAS